MHKLQSGFVLFTSRGARAYGQDDERDWDSSVIDAGALCIIVTCARRLRDG
jgi:hypothetical protein